MKEKRVDRLVSLEGSLAERGGEGASVGAVRSVSAELVAVITGALPVVEAEVVSVGEVGEVEEVEVVGGGGETKLCIKVANGRVRQEQRSGKKSARHSPMSPNAAYPHPEATRNG